MEWSASSFMRINWLPVNMFDQKVTKQRSPRHFIKTDPITNSDARSFMIKNVFVHCSNYEMDCSLDAVIIAKEKMGENLFFIFSIVHNKTVMASNR